MKSGNFIRISKVPPKKERSGIKSFYDKSQMTLSLILAQTRNPILDSYLNPPDEDKCPIKHFIFSSRPEKNIYADWKTKPCGHNKLNLRFSPKDTNEEHKKIW